MSQLGPYVAGQPNTTIGPQIVGTARAIAESFWLQDGADLKGREHQLDANLDALIAQSPAEAERLARNWLRRRKPWPN